MSYTIANLKDDLQGMLHGATINKVQNVESLINRAARAVLNDVDPSETKRSAQIANAIYDKVYDYAAPADLKENKVIDIRPQVNRGVGDKLGQRYDASFDQYKGENTFSIVNDSGVKYIRLSKSVKPGTLVNGANDITDNGTWVVGGDASDLERDTLHYISGGSSLKFNVSGAGTTAYIENSTMTAIDLSEDEDISALFVWFYIPSGSTVTNATLRWGSSSSDYWSQTVTSQNFGSFQTGWNLLRFDWDGSTETGTPTTSVDYIRFTFTYDGDAANNYRVDNIISCKGSIWEIVYYSKYLFRTSAGTWIENYTDDTDVINLDTTSYNLLAYKCLEFIAQQMQGSDSSFDYQVSKKEYQDEKMKYLEQNKSETKKTSELYYKIK